jgi:heme exporter protein B
MQTNSLASVFLTLLQRDMRVTWRRRSDSLQPLAFALVAATLFPIALGPELQQLSKIACGIIFVIVVLANLLTLDSLFRADLEDGSLDMMIVSGQPMEVLVCAKIVAHWLGTGLPLTLLAPCLALMLGLGVALVPIMLLSLLLATWLLSMLGACGAALTATMPRSGLMLSVLVLPLSIPVLIFATSAVDAWTSGLNPSAPLLFLTAGIALGLPTAPWLCAKALRIHTH